MNASAEPVRPEHLAKVLHARGFPVSLSTIYRNLQKLCNAGIVRKIARGPEGCCYELLSSSRHHHHLICRSCHRTVHITACPLDRMKRQLEQQTNFRIEDHTLEIFGYCPHCRKQQP
jgi:Fe2+ or Zn2+ uptake regulation protein